MRPNHEPNRRRGRFMRQRESKLPLTVGRLARATALALTMVLVSGGGGVAAAADAIVYGDSLAAGWQNWSWGSSVNLNGAGAVGGSRTIQWQPTSPWGGLYLHAVTAVQTSGSTSLQFALWATQWNQRLSVSVYGENLQLVGFAQLLSNVGGDPPAQQWKTYSIPLSSLGAAGQRITGVVLQDATGGPQSIAVDEIKLTDVSSGGASGGASGTDTIVYSDSLATGWQNWSWGSAVNLSGTGAFGGARSISWTPTSPWGGLYLHATTAVPTSSTTSLQFALRASQANQRLSVSVFGANAQPVGQAQLLAN